MNSDYAPMVTVYITNHNYGRFVEQAVESVLNQTLQDFELIIIDDGSTDNSREIIEGYGSNSKIIPIYQQNKGLNVTNNIAIRAARGKYIVRLDADDWLDEHMLEVLSSVLERNPDVGMVFPDYYNVDEAGHVIEVVRRHDFDAVTLHDQPAHGACTMIRRKCLQELGGYSESFRRQDGFDLWIRFIEHYKIQNVNLPLFHYRQHGSSLSRDESALLETRSEILGRQARRKGRQFSTIAIVPVRGPRLDPGAPVLKSLGGRPLLNWTLDSALAAERIQGVVFTSPDEELIDYVERVYTDKIVTVNRDPDMAMRNTLIEDTLSHALDAYEDGKGEVDAVMSLSIESPFRTAEHINSAVDVMELFKTDSVIGVRPDTDMLYQHNGAGLMPMIQVSPLRLEREEVFREVGQMQLVTTAYFREHHRVSGGRVGHVVLNQQAALTLRTQFDWKIATFYVRECSNSPTSGTQQADG